MNFAVRVSKEIRRDFSAVSSIFVIKIEVPDQFNFHFACEK